MRTAFPPVHFIVYTVLNSDRRQKTEQSFRNHQATKDMNAKVAEQKDQRQVGLGGSVEALQSSGPHLEAVELSVK